MSYSLVHAAFDPFPYVVLSACVEGIGVLLAVHRSRSDLHRTTLKVPHESTRSPARTGESVPMHSLARAER